HHFQTNTHDIHALWTINGKVALLHDIYDTSDINTAEIIHRDGHLLNAKIHIVCESPIYIRWPKNQTVIIKDTATLAKDLAIHAHIQALQYYPFCQDNWFGM
ncbi:MAG TPA: hypothetical protein DCW48_03585, partial [Methylotenera mobilis]|nr:hypothetical protein [Methylotenera mobilis]